MSSHGCSHPGLDNHLRSAASGHYHQMNPLLRILRPRKVACTAHAYKPNMTTPHHPTRTSWRLPQIHLKRGFRTPLHPPFQNHHQTRNLLVTAATPDAASGQPEPSSDATPSSSTTTSSPLSTSIATAVFDADNSIPDTIQQNTSLSTSSSFTTPQEHPPLLEPTIDDSTTPSHPVHDPPTSHTSSSSSYPAAAAPLQEPLLHHAATTEPVDTSSAPTSVAEEAKTLITLAGPISIQNVFGVSLSMIVTAFLGQLGAEQLSAAVLASSVYNVTGLSVVLGMTAGMESLCGQAFGAKNYRFMGLILQRAVLICWCLTLPLLLLFQNSSSVLGLLKQDPVVASGAARYLQMIGPCLLLHGAAECMRKYLLTQQIVRPSMLISGVVTALAPLYCWIFINRCGWGLEGGAVAYFCCHLSACLGMLGYLFYHHHTLKGQARQTWPGLTWSCLQDWPQYLAYGIPATIMICMEWWAFEILILMAGQLPTAVEAVAVMGVCFSISSFLYMLPLGLGSALNARVSMFLGAGQGNRARQVLVTAVVISGLLQGIMALLVWHNGPLVFNIFTSDPGVISLATLCLPIVAFMCLADGMNAVLSGVLRGAGRPTLGAIVNIVCYWGIGVPLSWYFGLQMGLGAQGFWTGITVAAFVQIMWVGIAINRWDWGKMGQDARAALRVAH